MKKYSFQMTEKETAELCRRAMWEELRLNRLTWLKLLALYIGRDPTDIKRNLCGSCWAGGTPVWIWRLTL